MKVAQRCIRLWHSYMTIGVDASMPFGTKRVIRALNFLGLLGAPIPTALSLNMWMHCQCGISVLLMGIMLSAVIASLPLFNYLEKTKLGASTFFIVAGINCVFDAAMLGPGFGIEYAFFFLLVGAFAFSNTRLQVVSYSIFSGFGTIACLYAYYLSQGNVNPGMFIAQAVFALSTMIFMYLNLNLLTSQSESYEQAIEVKNRELETQKLELTQQHDNLSKLHLAIREKNEKLGLKNFMITESLNYAKRIQLSTLPGVSRMQKDLGDSFVFFKPKDIVSGDFYWYEKQQNIRYFAVADCTGHGVPGAFMSLLGTNMLHQIVREMKFEKPSQILNELNDRLNRQLETMPDDENIREGMDITLCALNVETGNLQFSSAGRPVFLIRNCELTEYRSTRSYVGRSYVTDENFFDCDVTLEDGDTLYLFTDGFVDQFDITDKRKYSLMRLKKLLPEIFYVDMAGQLELIQAEFERWKGHTPQTDDVLIFGYRYKVQPNSSHKND